MKHFTKYRGASLALFSGAIICLALPPSSWAANKPDQWAQLVAMNVDGIISDDPEPLLKFLREKGLHK